MRHKVTKVFSGPLMKQSLRSNMVMTLVVLFIMCMMSVVISFAGNIIGSLTEEEDYTEAQSDFYSYLYVMASYNEIAGTSLNYDDFSQASDLSDYEAAFSLMTMQSGTEFTVEGLQTAADTLAGSDVPLESYVTQFEYVYALGSVEGCFSGEALEIDGLMTNMLEMMGLDPNILETMTDMDPTAMLNQMYYTIMIILPILLFIIVVGNALVVDQVDKGSMAYILSTPTKRSAVTITQMIYMILVPLALVAITCGVRIGATYAFSGQVDALSLLALYGGLYVLVEAMASICYFTSCFFNLSRYSMFLGGGINIWFFLASLLGMFGSDMMVSMGMGVEALNNFNKLTLTGLFDFEALATVGSEAVDTSFIWKLCVLGVIAVVLYIVGAIRFHKKDLPL